MSQTQTDKNFERTFSIAGPVTLEARLDAGALRVKQGADGTIEIRGVLRRRTSFPPWGDVEDRMGYLAENPPVTVSGGIIRMGDVESRLLSGISALFEVIVPRETGIRLKSDSADLLVNGIQGPIDCETDHGNVEAVAIDAEVRVTTDHGSVALRGIHGPVSVRSDSGTVEAIEISGRIDIRVDSARVVVSQTTPAPIRIHSDSGDATIRLAAGSGYDVSIETDHGNVRIPALENQQSSGGRIRGRLRGGGPLVEARTDHGDIEIE